MKKILLVGRQKMYYFSTTWVQTTPFVFWRITCWDQPLSVSLFSTVSSVGIPQPRGVNMQGQDCGWAVIFPVLGLSLFKLVGNLPKKNPYKPIIVLFWHIALGLTVECVCVCVVVCVCERERNAWVSKPIFIYIYIYKKWQHSNSKCQFWVWFYVTDWIHSRRPIEWGIFLN